MKPSLQEEKFGLRKLETCLSGMVRNAFRYLESLAWLKSVMDRWIDGRTDSPITNAALALRPKIDASRK